MIDTKRFNNNANGPAARMRQAQEKAQAAYMAWQLSEKLRELGEEEQADHWLNECHKLLEGK